MSNYPIPENSVYTIDIRQLERTDPANAELFNALFQRLIENTHAVKQKADNVDDLQEQVNSQQAEISGKADAAHNHTAGDITSGTLPIARGGTGQSTAQGIRNALGLGNTTGAVPIANGGTGQTTAAGVRNALGLGNTTGALPIANGGTGATSASAAVTALGLGKNLTFTGAATGTYNGQAAKSVLIPDRKGCRFVVGTSTAGHTLKDCDYLCDGTADQVEINNAISALPSTGGEVVVLAGTYRVTDAITINKPQTIIRGEGDPVINRNANVSIFMVRSDSVEIRNFILDGNKSNFTSETSLIFVGILNQTNAFYYTLVQNCIVKNSPSAGINFHNAQYFLCHNCVALNNKYGILIQKGDYGKILNCRVYNSSDMGIGALNSSSPTEYHCIIKNNIIHASKNGIQAMQTWNISNNMLLGNSGLGIFANSYCVISNNQITGVDGGSSEGIVTGGTSNIIGNNFIHKYNYGMKIATNNNVMDGNLINDCIYGIYINGQYNLIDGNKISKDTYGTTDYSVQVLSSNNLITNNLMWGKNYTNSGTNNTFVNNKYN